MKKGLIVVLVLAIIASSTIAFAKSKNVIKKPQLKVKTVKHLKKVTKTSHKPVKKVTKPAKKVTKPIKKITKPVTGTSGGGVDVITSPTKKGPGGREGGINPSNGTGTGIQGITTNKMPYEVVSDISTLPNDIQSNIYSLRESRGYYFVKNGDNGYIFTILSGQRNTGGYGINVTSVEDVEGITTITVEETAPKADQIVNMMVTYPSITLSLKNVNERIKVINTNGEEFSSLSIK
jgi:uncharacterized protein YcfJ